MARPIFRQLGGLLHRSATEWSLTGCKQCLDYQVVWNQKHTGGRQHVRRLTSVEKALEFWELYAAGPHGPRILPVRSFRGRLRSGGTRKNGLRIPLQEQPFRVLLVLLENPGRIVTREELQQRLWAADTFVEFDRGLNTAINKVREALSDSAGGPRFVETVPKRGYRFLAPVERVIAGDSGEPRVPGTDRNTLGPWPSVRKSALPIALLAAAAVLIWRGLHPREVLPDPPLRKFAFTSEDATDSGLATYGRAAISPDGRQIAYFGGGVPYEPGSR